MSLSATFPLLSSEIGLTGSGGTGTSGPAPLPSFHAFGGNSQSANLLLKQEKLSPTQSDTSSHFPPESTESLTSSSPSKKRKKKEHKHKKDKDDKEHRHKDKGKEEKKHKKDKHRDKDSEKHRSSKRMKLKSSDTGISHAQDNSLKIKIVASKEAMDSKSSRSSSKNIQPNQVVYY